MIRFMLDMDICIDLLRGQATELFKRLQQFEIDEIAISSITLAELQYGVERSSQPTKHEQILAQFCAPLCILLFDTLAAETYGRVRKDLEQAGTPIGPLDTLIVSHALSQNLTLVTHNEREFSRVAGLKVENWPAR